MTAALWDKVTGVNPAGDAGDTPPIFWSGGRQLEYPPILLRTFGYSRPILVAQTLPTEPPKGVGCGEGWFVPHNLELALKPQGTNRLALRRRSRIDRR